MSWNQLEDAVNPNLGWLIAPVAFVTNQIAFLWKVDPSIPELLYGIAAVIYAVAAMNRSTPKETSSHSSSTSETSKTQPESEDTVDVR